MADEQLADRIGLINLSPTMRVAAEADRLKRRGVAIVDLGAGEPDFPTPPHIIAAAKAAIDHGFTKYSPNAGYFDLREAVADRYAADYGVSYAADEVIITTGGKQALFHAALALFGPGDEVIVHTPGWPTLAEQITLAGATPVRVTADAARGFALTADLFLSAVTPRTRGIVINSPANPTGALMEAAEARELAVACEARGIWVVIDLCYEGIVFESPAPNLPEVFVDVMRDRLVLCGSVSKAHAMTGFRCGWLVGSRDVVKAANVLQSHETSGANSIAQRAALAALTGPQDDVRRMRDEYRVRRDGVLEWLGEESRLVTGVPRGAFYAFPSVQAFLRPSGSPTALDFAARLLQDEHVVVTPGEAFDAPGYLRLSCAASMDELREGVTRLIRFARRQVV